MGDQDLSDGECYAAGSLFSLCQFNQSDLIGVGSRGGDRPLDFGLTESLERSEIKAKLLVVFLC